MHEKQEPLVAQSVEHWTLDQLFKRSLDELKKSLGVPQVIEADKVEQVVESCKAIEGNEKEYGS